MKRIYHLSSCSTCKKIIQEISPSSDVQLIDIKQTNIDEETLDWLKSKVGSYEALFSKRAIKYRELAPNQIPVNDEDFKLRTAFEKWMNHINKLENATGATDPNSYMVDAYVYQLGRGSSKESTSNFSDANGGALTPLRTYKFYQIFPTNVSQIDLSYDTADDIETYTVEFQILYWTAGETTADQAGSTNIIK